MVLTYKYKALSMHWQSQTKVNSFSVFCLGGSLIPKFLTERVFDLQEIMAKIALGTRREATQPDCIQALVVEFITTFLFVFAGVASAMTAGIHIYIYIYIFFFSFL